MVQSLLESKHKVVLSFIIYVHKSNIATIMFLRVYLLPKDGLTHISIAVLPYNITTAAN